MFATDAFAHIALTVVWALALVTRDEAGRAVYSVHAGGRLVGRVVQCRRADGTGGTGFMLHLYGADGSAAELHLADWRIVRAITRNPRAELVDGGRIAAARVLTAA